MAKRSLLTKHGKFYELNPYKIISRLEDIRDYGDDPDDLIEQIYEELDLPR